MPFIYTFSIGDAEWNILESLIPPVQSNQIIGERPPKYERRAIIDAILYVKTTGCQWRNLPKDFPYWKTAYGYFYLWGRDGVWETIERTLVQKCRTAQGREVLPSAASINSQTVKTNHVSGVRGYDAGKKINGVKIKYYGLSNYSCYTFSKYIRP